MTRGDVHDREPIRIRVLSETDILRTKIQLAAHAYELDHGKPPTATRDLVPQYLKSVPHDPATDKELPLN